MEADVGARSLDALLQGTLVDLGQQFARVPPQLRSGAAFESIPKASYHEGGGFRGRIGQLLGENFGAITIQTSLAHRRRDRTQTRRLTRPGIRRRRG